MEWLQANGLEWNKMEWKGPKLANINPTEIPKPGNKPKWNTREDVDEMSCLIKKKKLTKGKTT